MADKIDNQETMPHNRFIKLPYIFAHLKSTIVKNSKFYLSSLYKQRSLSGSLLDKFANRINDADLIEKIKGNLAANHDSVFFTYSGDKPDWMSGSQTDFSLQNILVKSCGVTIGYIEHINVVHSAKHVWVGHFSTALNFRGARLGEHIARAFQKTVESCCGLNRIVFQENHLDYWEIGYAKFFTSLGAVPRRRNHPNRPAWIWQWGAAASVEGDAWEGIPPAPKPLPPPFIAGNSTDV